MSLLRLASAQQHVPRPADLSDNEKKTIYFRYINPSKLSPYDASFNSSNLADLQPSFINFMYTNFYNGFPDNRTLYSAYICPYSYNIMTGSSYNLKAVYDFSVSLFDSSISFTNSIRSGNSNLVYSGTGKAFSSLPNAVENFNHLLDKIQDVLLKIPRLLSNNIDIPTLTIQDVNLIDGIVQIGPRADTKKISAEESKYGKYSIYTGANQEDQDLKFFDSNGTTQVNKSVSNITVYLPQVQEILDIIQNIRNNNMFKESNTKYQPKQKTEDKTVSEVFDAIIDSLQKSIIALKSSYQKVNETSILSIENNRTYIENRMRELEQLPGTEIDNYKTFYTSTMVAGALWTVLATSLVFYVFNELQ